MNTSLISAIKIDPDGGYKDIVIRIASDGSVPENDCPKILYNIKVSDFLSFVITLLKFDLRYIANENRRHFIYFHVK